LSEYTKSEILLHDLNAIETQVSILVSNCSELTNRKLDLEKQLESAKQTISELNKKANDLEMELSEIKNGKDNNTLFNSITNADRANLKARLQNMLTRIDYHISS